MSPFGGGVGGGEEFSDTTAFMKYELGMPRSCCQQPHTPACGHPSREGKKALMALPLQVAALFMMIHLRGNWRRDAMYPRLTYGA